MLGALIRTILSRFLLLIIMLVLAIPVLIILLMPERIRYDNVLACWIKYIFYRSVLAGSFVPIEFVGRENMPQEPSIIVANHQSSLDIPLIGSLVGIFPHVWLATNELMTSPILRWILPRATALVDVSNPMNGMRSLVAAIGMVYNKKRHAIIFPEGGRHADGAIHDFYGGFVILAKKTGRPIVPILIQGAYKVYPKGSFLVHYHPIRVTVGRPIMKTESETDEDFKERVHRWFIATNQE